MDNDDQKFLRASPAIHSKLMGNPSLEDTALAAMLAAEFKADLTPASSPAAFINLH